MGTKTIISGKRNQGLDVIGSNNTVIVAANGTINAGSGDFAIRTDYNSSHNHLTINGKLFSAASSGDEAIIFDGHDSTLKVGASGEVIGSYGIYSYGSHLTINNAGFINSLGSDAIGVAIQDFSAPSDNSHLRNSGTVFGDTAVYMTVNGSLDNFASGRIIGGEYGIHLGDGKLAIANHGLIKAGNYAIYDGFGSAQTITSDGTITGTIDLGGGNDVLDTRGGVIKGNIYGGAGDDTLYTDNAKFALVEGVGEGNDWIKSTVTYTLPDYVETLTLLGKKNINATGNSDAGQDNFLFGNSGDNVLRGLGGTNLLCGRGGTDTLVGGADYDLFGIGKGYGHDVARNYEDGLDQITLDGINVSLAQIKSHVKQHGNDTWIEFGQDVLILKGVDHSVLDQSDFTYF